MTYFLLPRRGQNISLELLLYILYNESKHNIVVALVGKKANKIVKLERDHTLFCSSSSFFLRVHTTFSCWRVFDVKSYTNPPLTLKLGNKLFLTNYWTNWKYPFVNEWTSFLSFPIIVASDFLFFCNFWDVSSSDIIHEYV